MSLNRVRTIAPHERSRQQPGAPRTGVDWGRAEFLLVGFGLLGFVTLLVRVTTIYSGLPAHPLFLHVPVMLVPITVIAAIVLVVRTDWLERYGIALSIVSVIAMSSIFLTMQAGGALESALHLHGEAAHLIDQHSEAAKILAILYVLFTATVIVAFAARRISGGRPTGLALVDRVLSPSFVLAALRVLVVVLAIGSAAMVFRTGDLGSKAVWHGRLEARSR